jgi:2'-5' RNA ligase
MNVVAVRDDGALLVTLSRGDAAAIISDDGVWVTTRGSALARGSWSEPSGEKPPAGVLADQLNAQLTKLNAENNENNVDDENVTAAAEMHTGAMIALVPSDADLARLAVKGGEPADQLHTTLLYLGDAVSYTEETREALVDCLSGCAAHLAPFVVDGFAIALFNPAGVTKSDGKQRDACVTLMVSGEELEPVRHYIWNDFAKVPTAFGLPDQHTPWIPHITLTYTDDTDVTPYSNMVGPVTFVAIRVAFGGEVYDLPLGEERTDEPNYDEDYDDDITAGYDPHELRDNQGQWTDSPSSGTLKDFVRRFRRAYSGDKAHKRVTSSDDFAASGPDGYGAHHKNTIDGMPSNIGAYQTAGMYINGSLRDGTADTKWGHDSDGFITGYPHVVATLDAIFASDHSKLDHDIVVERGIQNPQAIFGDHWSSDGDNAGLSWDDPGFVSTTSSSDVATHFTAEEHKDSGVTGSQVIMRILVPKGSHAFKMGRFGAHDQYAWEQEILLPRGSSFRIVADHGVGSDGIRHVDVEMR